MSRLGVTLNEGTLPRIWLRADPGFAEPNEMTASQLLDFDATVKQIEQDVRNAGKTVQWSKYVKDPERIGHFCEHFPGELGLRTQTSTPNASRAQSAHDINLAYRFDLAQRAIWVTRATCRGGTLGGNLVSAASLNIFDTASTFSTHAQHRVDKHETVAADFTRGVFETDFDAKLFNERYIVTYAPSEGALMVYDLSYRRFLMKLNYGRRGDLLADVFLSEDGQFLYQLNNEGSFTVYDLPSAEPVLEGRYLDDEVVIWTATYHFDSTEEGDAFVELRFPGTPGQYSFQQFQNALRVPDLMQQVLEGSVRLPTTRVKTPPKLEGWVAAKDAQVSGAVTATGSNPIKRDQCFSRWHPDGPKTDTKNWNHFD